MKATSIPALLSVAFAWNGPKNSIATDSNPPHATLSDGFPSITMKKISEGGQAPDGKDLNGILNWITQLLVWQNSGGLFPYDSDLCTAIGGYPLGAVVKSTDGLSAYVSLTDNNLTDPNETVNIGTTWAPFCGAIGETGHYAIAQGAANAIYLTLAPTRSTYTKGQIVIFKASFANTGAVTLNAGGGVVPLVRNDGQALVAKDLSVDSIYCALYDSATSSFMLLTPVTTQLSQGTTTSTGSTTTTVTLNIPIGSVLPFTGTSIPTGFLACDGRTLGSGASAATVANDAYKSLYTVLWSSASNVWDSSSNSVTKGTSAATDWTAGRLVKLPDYRGRTLVGSGQGTSLTNRTLGASGGEETHTLSTSEMPAHQHLFPGDDFGGWAQPWPSWFTKSESIQYDASSDNDHTGGIWHTSPTGGGLSHNNMQPYAVASWIILATNGSTDTSTSSNVITGSVTYFAMQSAPSGWLECDGSAVSRTTYSSLYSAIGTIYGTGDGSTTFNLPDLRGMFLRGWDHSRGLDSGRSFGSSQLDSFKSHTHTSIQQAASTVGSGTTAVTFNAASSGTTGSTGGSETRPVNVALLPCIKY